MRRAPGVQGVAEVLVSGVAVADDRAGVAGEDAAGVDVLRGPAAGVHGGEELGAGDVHVPQLPGRAGGGLVGVQHCGGAQELADPVHERPQPGGGPAAGPGHEPGGHVYPGQGRHQGRCPRGRQVMGADGQRRPGMHPRPVLNPAGDIGGRHADGDLPADPARLRPHLVLDHRRRRRGRRLEHLEFLRPGHLSIRQVRAAAAARHRDAFHRLTRVSGLL